MVCGALRTSERTLAIADASLAHFHARSLAIVNASLAIILLTPLPPSPAIPPSVSRSWWSEAAHGVSHVNNVAPTPWASNTILPITASCAFNRSLWTATGNQIGREARAFMNAGHADSTYWAPVINIVRDPRWGRNIESAGEDPFVSGQYAANWVSIHFIGNRNVRRAPSHRLTTLTTLRTTDR